MTIDVAIAGVGNCASSLVQGVAFYRRTRPSSDGLITDDIGGYGLADINFVAAFDVDARKVGHSLAQAVFAHPNKAMSLCTDDLPQISVSMGPVLDGIADHLVGYPATDRPCVADERPVDVVDTLRRTGAQVLICYLPVGSAEAVRYYAECALAAEVAFINCVPVRVAGDPELAERFTRQGVPIVGDDVRSQVGATIVHQRMVELLCERGYRIERTYQLNVGGNTDFLNMLDRTRLGEKKRSKTSAVTSRLNHELHSGEIHVGPSDYLPQLGDAKTAFIHLEAKGFGGAPLKLDIKLDVQDSPNSAAVVADVVRYAALAREIGMGGPILPVCSYYMKSPPKHLSDHDVLSLLSSLRSRQSLERM